MITMDLAQRLLGAVQALATALPWLAACGTILFMAGLALRVWLRRAERITQDGVERHFANTLSKTGLWAGVQLLKVRSTRLSPLLEQLTEYADQPAALIYELQSERASLLGPTRLTVLDDTYATDWVQRTLEALGRQPVPADGTHLSQRLLAVVFAGEQRPTELSSLPALAQHLEGCSAVGLVTCPVLPVAQVAGVARWASLGLLLLGPAAILLSLCGLGVGARARVTASLCTTNIVQPPAEHLVCPPVSTVAAPPAAGVAMTPIEPPMALSTEVVTDKKKDPSVRKTEAKEAGGIKETRENKERSKEAQDRKKLEMKPTGAQNSAGADTDRTTGTKTTTFPVVDLKTGRVISPGGGTTEEAKSNPTKATGATVPATQRNDPKALTSGR